MNRISYKQYHKKELSAEAKVISALIKKQPQKIDSICKSAKISKTTFYRIRFLLINEGIIRETDKGYVLWNYDLVGIWDRLQDDLKRVGGNLVAMTLQRASYAGRDKKTCWRLFRHDTKDEIEGFLILKNAIRLVVAVRPYGIHFGDEYDGVFLTRNLLGWKDRLVFDERLFEVRDVEELLDGSDSIGFYVGKLAEVIPSKDRRARVSSSSGISDPRDQVREFLISNLDCNNITRDDDSTKVDYCVMYDNPDYSLLKEFSAPNDSVDGIFAIGIPNSVPLIDSDHTVIGYNEHVPILIYTIDKVGASGARLQGKMEAELRRVCDSDSARAGSMHVYLERHSDRKTRIGSKTLYTAEFVFSFKRNARG